MYRDKNPSNISFPSLNFIQHKKVQLILFSLTLSKMISRVYRTLKFIRTKMIGLSFVQHHVSQKKSVNLSKRMQFLYFTKAFNQTPYIIYYLFFLNGAVLTKFNICILLFKCCHPSFIPRRRLHFVNLV